MDRKPNEVGAIWKKANDKGEYLSMQVDLDALLELTGGVMSGKVFINGYPLKNSSDRAPVYRLMYYPPRSGEQPARRPAAQPVLDDDIPF